MFSINKIRFEECWVKVNKVETIEHTFLVHNIKDELIKTKIITNHIEINIVQKPDLIFKNYRGEEITIEVETGINFKRKKKKIKAKFDDVSKKYNKIIVVLTNSQMKRHYEALLPEFPILTRKDLLDLFHTKNKKK